MHPSSKQQVKKEREWYSVSTSAVRQALTLLGILAAMFGGIFGYRLIDTYFKQRQALEVLDDASEVARRIEAEQSTPTAEYRDARSTLEEARQIYDNGNFRHALETGNLSLQKLRQVLRGAEGAEGTILVVNIQGSVEFRRGERGAWKRARVNDSLDAGDWVKTSGGSSADLLFPNNAQFRLRSNTMVHLGGMRSGGGRQRSTNIAAGEVGLKTSEAPIAVATPNTDVQVRRDTEGVVAFDRSKNLGRFATFEGDGMEVRSANGQTLSLGKLEQVIQEGDLLAKKKVLLAQPGLQRPADTHEINLDRSNQVTLAWRPVQNARRYRLRVSSSQYFASVVVETERIGASARLGIRGEGNFYWQVAAVDADETLGPWSEARTFRVAAMGGVAAPGAANDQIPPQLEIFDTESYGRMVVVRGQTDPGSAIKINGQSIEVKRDGTFLATVRMDQDGWGFVEVEAADVWKNATTERERVFIDAL